MAVDYTEKRLREIIDSDPLLRNRMQNYARFSAEWERIRARYAASKAPEELAEGIRVMSEIIWCSLGFAGMRRESRAGSAERHTGPC